MLQGEPVDGWGVIGPLDGRSQPVTFGSTVTNSTLHEHIITSFLGKQRAPGIAEIAAHFRCDEVETRRGLRALADDHGVVLHPKTDEVRVAHLFSATPTPFVVRTGERR